MSAAIKPGQIWQWNSALPHEGGLVITKIEGSNVYFRYEDGLIKGEHYRVAEHFTERAHLVTDPTPAPLDRSAVKAGDTVTVRHLGAPNTPMRPFEATGEVYDWGGLHVAGLDLYDPYVTLTAHQPAAEPEPGWKVGTLAVVTPSMWGGIVNRALRGGDGAWHTEAGGTWEDDEVSDVHELVVIDPAAGWWAEIHNALVAAGIGDAGSAASIALRTLGIEVAR